MSIYEKGKFIIVKFIAFLNYNDAMIYSDETNLIIDGDITFNGNINYKDREVTINKGIFTEPIVIESGKLGINGGTFDANVVATVISAENIKIAGGIFTITEKEVYKKTNPTVMRVSLGMIGKSIELSGGKFISDMNGVAIGIETEDKKYLKNH